MKRGLILVAVTLLAPRVGTPRYRTLRSPAHAGRPGRRAVG